MRGAALISKKRLAAVVALALLVRLALMLWGQSGLHVETPSVLSSTYFRQGYALAAGLGYVVGAGEAKEFLAGIQQRVNAGELVAKPGSVGSVPSGLYADTLHPPGMAILVAVLHRLLELPADIPVQFVGALLDALASGLVYWIGATLLGSTAGLVAGLLYAVFLPQAWLATGAQTPDGLIGPFIVAMVGAYVMALRSADWQRAFGWYMLAGLALGLGSYLRPDYLLAPVAMFPFLWLFLRRLRIAFFGSLAVLLVALAVLSPWAHRNHQVYGKWIFTSSGAGATLVTGLGEFKNPWGIGPTDAHRHAEAANAGYRTAWLPEADEYFRDVWWNAVRSDPGAFLLSLLKRLPLALAPPNTFGLDNPKKTRTFTETRAIGQDRYEAMLNNPIYVLGAYWDVLLMGLFSGAAFLASLWWLVVDRRRSALILLILSVHLYSIAVHVLIHLEPRFLLPSMFVFLFGLARFLTRHHQSGTELTGEEVFAARP